MANRYFTILEANSHVPELHSAFIGVMQLRAQLKTLYERLDSAGFAPSHDDADELPEDASPEVQQDRARFYGLVETLREQVERIQSTGCEIKDIESGLVDWLARHDGRDIWLCWRFGESEVRFWHDLESGFAGRRPVSELTDLLPSVRD